MYAFFYIQPSPKQGTTLDLIIHVHIWERQRERDGERQRQIVTETHRESIAVVIDSVKPQLSSYLSILWKFDCHAKDRQSRHAVSVSWCLSRSFSNDDCNHGDYYSEDWALSDTIAQRRSQFYYPVTSIKDIHPNKYHSAISLSTTF